MPGQSSHMAPPRAVFQFADACGGTFILTGTLDQISDVLRSMTCASIFATVETVLTHGFTAPLPGTLP